MNVSSSCFSTHDLSRSSSSHCLLSALHQLRVLARFDTQWRATWAAAVARPSSAGCCGRCSSSLRRVSAREERRAEGEREGAEGTTPHSSTVPQRCAGTHWRSNLCPSTAEGSGGIADESMSVSHPPDGVLGMSMKGLAVSRKFRIRFALKVAPQIFCPLSLPPLSPQLLYSSPRRWPSEDDPCVSTLPEAAQHTPAFSFRGARTCARRASMVAVQRCARAHALAASTRRPH